MTVFLLIVVVLLTLAGAAFCAGAETGAASGAGDGCAGAGADCAGVPSRSGNSDFIHEPTSAVALRRSASSPNIWRSRATPSWTCALSAFGS